MTDAALSVTHPRVVAIGLPAVKSWDPGDHSIAAVADAVVVGGAPGPGRSTWTGPRTSQGRCIWANPPRAAGRRQGPSFMSGGGGGNEIWVVSRNVHLIDWLDGPSSPMSLSLEPNAPPPGPTAKQVECFTLVLRGHLGLRRAVFPGRPPRWRHGRDVERGGGGRVGGDGGECHRRSEAHYSLLPAPCP